MSVHCGGVVIVPDRIDRHVPVETAPKGVQIIQWEKDQAEDAGLVKIDLLGNRSLAVIRDALAAVKENYGDRDRLLGLGPDGGSRDTGTDPQGGHGGRVLRRVAGDAAAAAEMPRRRF